MGAACTEDTDCDTGWCLTEKSFPDNYCSKDCSTDPTVCGDKSTCHEYSSFKFCMRKCGSDTDCRQGYVCDYDICLPPCQADKFCKTGDTCFSGRCKPKCGSDADCGGGDLRCQDGKCVPPCKKDGDCLPGNTCDLGSGNCKPKPGKPMGDPCGNDSQCATGYCLKGRRICSITCTSSKQCPSAYTCGLETYDKDLNGTKDSAEAACVPAKGPKIAGEICAKDADCASEHCYNGLCMEGCGIDTDCGAPNMGCATVNILLEGAIPTYKGCLPRTGVTDFTIGTFTGTTSLKGIDIPPFAESFIITTQVPSVTELGVVGQLIDPKGSILTGTAKDQCGIYSEINRYLYDVQYSSLYVPITPTKLVPGVYTYSVGASQANLPVTVKLKMKLGLAQKGTIHINWFFLNLAGTCVPGATLNAASAKNHTWLNKIRNNMGSILTKAGLKIGNQTYTDVKDPALDVIDFPASGHSVELQKLFAKSQGKSGNSINVFFVKNLKSGGGMMGGIILGIAGGIPGPAGDHGSVHSGVAMSMQTACFEQYGYNPAHTLVHELGHYLGLSHNLENTTVPGFRDNQVVCPCPCGPNLVCVSQTSGTKWCRGMDSIPDTDTSVDNLMYFAAESTQDFKGNKLTPGQIRVMLNNPVVGF